MLNEQAMLELSASAQHCPYVITVLTPTFNRAHLLSRVFESLTQQTFRNLEWLVVDDGSADNTAEVVARLKQSAPFPVRYVLKPNGGKPSAVNRGAIEARGYLLAILDSDDWYLPQALERFWHHWQGIPPDTRSAFVGVTGLCSDAAGKMIGSRFPADIFDSDAIDLRYRHKVQGEKSGVVRTDVLRQFPYPEDLGKYISESVVWNRIARTFKTRFFNEMLTVKEFQPDGITLDGRLLQVRNSKASLFTCRELLAITDRLPWIMKLKTYANFIRHALHQGVPVTRQIVDVPLKVMYFLCFPMGAYLRARDRAMLNKRLEARPNTDIACKS
jgi:glycosyltransferase involved in cell wall biosynthesis